MQLRLPEAQEVSILDFGQEIDECYSLAYSCQLLPQFHKFATLDGEPVEILAMDRSYKHLHTVEILRLNHGTTERVDVRNLKFKVLSFYKDQRWEIKDFSKKN